MSRKLLEYQLFLISQQTIQSAIKLTVLHVFFTRKRPNFVISTLFLDYKILLEYTLLYVTAWDAVKGGAIKSYHCPRFILLFIRLLSFKFHLLHKWMYMQIDFKQKLALIRFVCLQRLLRTNIFWSYNQPAKLWIYHDLLFYSLYGSCTVYCNSKDISGSCQMLQKINSNNPRY